MQASGEIEDGDGNGMVPRKTATGRGVHVNALLLAAGPWSPINHTIVLLLGGSVSVFSCSVCAKGTEDARAEGIKDVEVGKA